MPSTRIIIVEDDELTRETVRKALSKNKIDVLRVTQSVAEAIDFAKKNRPQVAVIDFNLGSGPNGIDVAQALRKFDPEIGIVLLTALLNPAKLPSMMAKLPKGSKYLIKQSVNDIDVLVTAIADAMNFDLSD